MSNMSNMSTQIVSVLTAVQQAGHPAFPTVVQYPTTNFESGTPGVTVVPSDNTSDYATIVQNFRGYVFFVDIYIPVEDTNGGIPTAFTTMLTLVDTCLDAIDNSNDLNNACDILRPAPSAWSLVSAGPGELLTARITLNCMKTTVTDNG